jgi:hypothetical protein
MTELEVKKLKDLHLQYLKANKEFNSFCNGIKTFPHMTNDQELQFDSLYEKAKEAERNWRAFGRMLNTKYGIEKGE